MDNSTAERRLITSFHAHIYYCGDDAAEKEHARKLYAELGRLGSDFVQLGRFHERLVGPHSRPMFTAMFDNKQFHQMVTYLMLNHHPLSVLIHPETDDDLTDHTKHALWLGDKVEIYFDKLSAKQV